LGRFAPARFVVFGQVKREPHLKKRIAIALSPKKHLFVSDEKRETTCSAIAIAAFELQNKKAREPQALQTTLNCVLLHYNIFI
jgi:hypothetical protein